MQFKKIIPGVVACAALSAVFLWWLTRNKSYTGSKPTLHPTIESKKSEFLKPQQMAQARKLVVLGIKDYVGDDTPGVNWDDPASVAKYKKDEDEKNANRRQEIRTRPGLKEQCLAMFEQELAAGSTESLIFITDALYLRGDLTEEEFEPFRQRLAKYLDTEPTEEDYLANSYIAATLHLLKFFPSEANELLALRGFTRRKSLDRTDEKARAAMALEIIGTSKSIPALELLDKEYTALGPVESLDWVQKYIRAAIDAIKGRDGKRGERPKISGK